MRLLIELDDNLVPQCFRDDAALTARSVESLTICAGDEHARIAPANVMVLAAIAPVAAEAAIATGTPTTPDPEPVAIAEPQVAAPEPQVDPAAEPR